MSYVGVSYSCLFQCVCVSFIYYFIFFNFRQLRNLEKAFGGDVRVCDRTALILDIFNQRAATHEAALQVKIKLVNRDDRCEDF